MSSAPVTSQDFSEIRWRGHWIWCEPPAPRGHPIDAARNVRDRKPAHGFFRRTFTLDRVPDRVPARITADSRYVLYVNGQEVARGPIRSQPRRMFYDLLDLAPFLQVGENTVAIHVRFYGHPTSYWIPPVPNVTLGWTGVAVFEADLGDKGWLISDENWKATRCDAWSEPSEDASPIGGGVPMDIFDARQYPFGWEQPGFDDSGWGQASLVPAMHIGGFARTQPPTDPYGPLFPRPIAQLTGDQQLPASARWEQIEGPLDLSSSDPVRRVAQTMAAPIVASTPDAAFPMAVHCPADSAVRIAIDMGRIVSGFVQFELDAPTGTTVDIAYTEEPMTGPPEMFGMHAGTRYIARGENDRYQVTDSNGFRYAYLLIHSTAGPVTLRSFAVREHLYPWSGNAFFECSDPELNRIFQAGIRTVHLNSHDAFLDCPTREQRAWVGDSVVHQMIHLATNEDWRLAWHYLTLANSPRYDGILPMSVAGEIEAAGGVTIPDWALHWVHGVYNLYRFAGDRDRVKAFMPTVERILRWYAPFQTSSGVLKDVVEWNLVDWSSVSTEDTSALLTALWARGLREFAEMAAWLEEKASQAWAEALYARAKAGFEIFWDEARGSYVDHVVDGEQRPEMSQLSGALAIVSGLAPVERWGRIIETITDESRLVERAWSFSPEEGFRERLEKQLRGIYEIDWDVERQIVLSQPFMQYVVHDAVVAAGKAEMLPRLYRRWSQFLTGGYDTIGECWSWGTHVHGWSCTPTRDMVFYTLGVTPAEPGYTAARVAPRLGDLEWARGAVPTPSGLIEVEVTRERLTVTSPVPVILDLPGQPPRRLDAGRHEISLS
ncbi:MAG: glycoside hydrolase family 78 protein [Anaerolineae bacterium]